MIGDEKDLENKKIVYTIYKNRVWIELLYKNVPMNAKVVYEGKNKKDCQRWIKENVKC